MSKTHLAYVDRVVDASMAPAARTMEPLVKRIRLAIDGVGDYAEADAALRRLEGERADGLEPVLQGAMMNATSAGAVEG